MDKIEISEETFNSKSQLINTYVMGSLGLALNANIINTTDAIRSLIENRFKESVSYWGDFVTNTPISVDLLNACAENFRHYAVSLCMPAPVVDDILTRAMTFSKLMGESQSAAKAAKDSLNLLIKACLSSQYVIK